MRRLSIPALLAAASVGLLAPLAPAQGCPPGSEQMSVVVSDSFGPFSGIFMSSLTVPQWNPNDFRANAELLQVQVEISSAITSSAFVSNDGDSTCTGGWSASNEVQFVGVPALGIPQVDFVVLRTEGFTLAPGAAQPFPPETVMNAPPPFFESNPENLALWTGGGNVVFPINGLTVTSCESNCGVVFCNIDLMAEIRIDVTYTYCVQANQPPVCIAGALVQNFPCQGEVTAIPLDGSASFDPDGDELSFFWDVQCDNAFVDDPTSPTPTLFFATKGACNADCVVFLSVSDGTDRTGCVNRIFVFDALAPVVECEPELAAVCGASSPEDLGFPPVFDLCDPSPMLVHEDAILDIPVCPATRRAYTIQRTWYGTDTCGNIGTCLQDVEVYKPIVSLDVLPGTCPNVLQVLDCPPDPAPVVITIAGSATVDVMQIDLQSLLLWQKDCLAGGIAPVATSFVDETRPVDDPAACPDRDPDGILDLRLEFDRAQVVSSLGLDQVTHGTTLALTISGDFIEGCPFVGFDFVTVVSCATKR